VFAKCPDESAEKIYATYHLGYEFDRQLRDYSQKLKIVYCAVADKRRNVRACAHRCKCVL